MIWNCCVSREGLAPVEERKVSILIMGTGEAGKSTIARQLKLSFGGGLNADFMEGVKTGIVYNIFDGIRVLLEAMETLDLRLGNEGEIAAKAFQSYRRDHSSDILSSKTVPSELVHILKQLLPDQGFDQVVQKRDQFQTPAFWMYFVEKLLNSNTEWGKQGWQVSIGDAIRVRLRTIGIPNFDFVTEHGTFDLLDAGGQMRERKKWLEVIARLQNKPHCILYVVSLGDYDQTMFEKDGVNRLEDALDTWSKIVNLQEIKTIPVYLLMNKIDLLEEKFCERKIPIPHIDNQRKPPIYDASKPKEVNRNRALNWYETLFTTAIDDSERHFDVPTYVSTALNSKEVQETFTRLTSRMVQETTQASDYHTN